MRARHTSGGRDNKAGTGARRGPCRDRQGLQQDEGPVGTPVCEVRHALLMPVWNTDAGASMDPSMYMSDRVMRFTGSNPNSKLVTGAAAGRVRPPLVSMATLARL